MIAVQATTSSNHSKVHDLFHFAFKQLAKRNQEHDTTQLRWLLDGKYLVTAPLYTRRLQSWVVLLSAPHLQVSGIP